MKQQIITLILLLIVIPGFVLAAVSTGKFTIGNEPPTASNLRVQDGASSWDSIAPLDTHDITPNFQWNLADPNPDTLKTKVCISSSAARTCDLVNDTSLTVIDTYTVSQGVLSWPACGTSKTYYIDLTPNDGTVDGAKISSTFDILNLVPTTSNLVMNPEILPATSPRSTHSQTPTFSWTATDADDGSIDKWPADTLTNSILVGDTCGESQYLSGTNPAGGTTSTIPWGAINPVTKQSVKDFCSRIAATDNASCTASLDTNLQLIDNIPNSSTATVKLSDNLAAMRDCKLAGDLSPCWIDPKDGDYQSVNLEVSFSDADGDCSGLTNTIQVTLVHPDKNYTYTLNYDSKIGSTCTFKKSVPAGDSAGIEFFRAPLADPVADPDFDMSVSITSQAGSLTPAIFGWDYSPNKAINYQATIDLGDPSTCPPGNDIQLGNWNPGTCLALMKNWGNKILTLDWEATDPSSNASTCSGHTGTCWDLSTSDDFQVDDDNVQTNDTGNLAAVNIPEDIIAGNGNQFNPISGLKVCTDIACSAPADANLNTYFHILPPTGLSPGTYTTTMTITLS